VKYGIHPEAAAEHRRQVAYYEQRQRGLGQRYHAEFRAMLALACEAPLRYRVAFPPTIRRIRFRIFRFDLIYRQANEIVQVLAIAPQRRQPNYWLTRL